MIQQPEMFQSSGEPRGETLWQQLAGLGAGAHVCPLYETPGQRMGALVPYFQAGLARGEQCLYIADGASLDDLRALGIGTDEDLARAALVLLTARETYLRHGRFDPDKMIELLTERLAAAHAAGFAGLRVAGEMSWALGSDIGSERLIEYEARLNAFLAASGIRALCQYDVRRFQASVLRDVLRTHPLAIFGERMHDNVYFEPPTLVLGGADVDGQRVAWMREQLEARTRREVALADLGQLALVGAPPGELTAAAMCLVAVEIKVEFAQLYDSPFASGEPSPGRPLIIPDWTHEPRFELASVPRPPDVKSSAFVAASPGQSKRVLGVHSREPRIFSSNELVFMETVAIMLAHAIERRRGEDQFRTLVENAADPIARLNQELRIEYVNPAVERTTGTPAESLIGRSTTELGMILEPLLPTYELLLRQVRRSGREQALEVKARTPLGERIFESRVVPEPGPDGAVQSLLTISRDVTEHRRAEANLSAVYQQLVAQQDRVQELLSHMGEKRERTPPAAQLDRLTKRERLILRRLTAGLTNRQIGAEMGLTVGTVKNQVARILSKLNVTDRTQAAVRAVELGLVRVADQEQTSSA
jgi:PAS domain S-box-containing protein